VFVDCDDSFCINADLIESAITKKTKAIVPVHLTGNVADMAKITAISNQYGIPIVEDSCQAILGQTEGKNAGTWGTTGTFSLHPLKNLNVWSDGGVIVTDDDALERRLRLLRNHGLSDRDTVSVLGCNSRLDTFQAIVGMWLLPDVHRITSQRIANARYYDDAFSDMYDIKVPVRPQRCRSVYHLYMLFAEKRDELLKFCTANGVEAKVHYPTPIYCQPALQHLGYSHGNFPVTDRHANSVISFPCDQYLSEEQLQFVIQTVHDFSKT
jgi:dTDP-4-amino-4,6-dideoxygalactose transaminase